MDPCQLLPGDYRTYLAQFTREAYADAFQRYSALAQPVFAAMTEDAAAPSAAALTDHCGTLLRPLRRKTTLFDLQQLFALYTVPAAMAFGGAAAVFARQLAEQWASRYPQFAFQIGTYDALMQAFQVHRIFGFDISRSKKSRD